MTRARAFSLSGILGVASRAPRGIASALILSVLLGPSPAAAQEGDGPDDGQPAGETPPVDEAPPADDAPRAREATAQTAEVIARLDRLESRLDRLEEKLDRLEALLRTVHGERLRRAGMLAADPALAAAVARIEERYGVARADEYLIADETERVVALAKKLGRTSAELGPLEFCSDPDVARVVAAVADRRDYMAEGGHRLVVSISGGRPEATGALVSGLLDLPSPGAREAALWAAPFAGAEGPAEGDGLAERLSRLAADPDEENARVALLARAAAAAHGDARAEDALAEIVRSGDVDGAFALQVAANLRGAASVAAFRVYLELLRDDRYAYAAAQAFGSVDGFGRTIGWREVREGRDGLYDELSAWLRLSRARLRFDHGRFRVEPPADGR